MTTLIMTRQQFLRISKLADYITNKLITKFENQDEEDFIRENDIIKSWSFLHNFTPNQQDINEALYKINCHFKNPVIFSKLVNNKESSQDYERAFFYNNKGLNDRGSISYIVENSDKLLPTKREMLSEDDKLCTILMSEKSGIFLFIQLKRESTALELFPMGEFTENPYHFYVFNSMFSNFMLNNKVYLNIEDFTHFETSNKYKIYYPKSHFNDFEIGILKAYNYN